MKKKTTCILAALVMAATVPAGTHISVSALSRSVSVAAVSPGVVREVAEGIVAWKKSDVGASENEYLINDTFLSQAGTTPGDWFPIGLGRLGIQDNQAGYLAVIGDNVQKRYNKPEKLDGAKATEWHRISLAVLASGGNPRRMGDGGAIDLIADGTYNRVDGNGNGILQRQGINGLIWGLIALDSLCYETPEDAAYTRDDIIRAILARQLADGGWALSGTVSDPDITAMTLQAFAPYYNSEKEYTFAADDVMCTKKVRAAVDEALEWLSDAQRDSGGYYSWGTANAESTVQVLVAVTSLGIDPFADGRFCKTDGAGRVNTLWDGLMRYRTASGGFTHSFVNDAQNPSSAAGEPNTMASEQALYCMAAVERFLTGKRRLYDFRPEQSDECKAVIAAAEARIAALTADSSVADIRSAYDSYLGIDALERSYVTNYSSLSRLLALVDIEYEEETPNYNDGDAGIKIPTEYFTYNDREAVRALPVPLTTASRSEVLRLWNKINCSVDFDGKQEFTIALEKAKNEIDSILNEIESIKAAIRDELYPFGFIGLSKRKTVNELYGRYIALSEYDRSQFEPSDIEGLIKCRTQTDTLFVAMWVSICAGTAAVGIIVWVIVHIRKRKKAKAALAMEESDE